MEDLLKQRPLRHPQVLWRAIEDETLVVNLDTRRVSVLNRVGGRVWSLMDGSRDLDEILDQVARAYDVDRGRVKADVEAFVRELADREMLEWA
jgi:hypothetical protein